MSDGINTLMYGGFIAKNTLLRKIRERRQHTPAQILEEYSASQAASAGVKSLAWGHDSEGKGVAYYELTRGVTVERPGFIVHPLYDWCGGSPDFIEDDDGERIAGEVKCPMVPGIHLNYLTYKQLTNEHYNQVQGNIAVTNAVSGKFLSFDPRQKLESHVLSVVNVPRDDVWQVNFNTLAAEFDAHLRLGTSYSNPITKAVDGLPTIF
jgi:hypothetical protein